ncbi:MAG: hypothetical protein EZS28_034074, partial [Streblomastix strix]
YDSFSEGRTKKGARYLADGIILDPQSSNEEGSKYPSNTLTPQHPTLAYSAVLPQAKENIIDKNDSKINNEKKNENNDDKQQDIKQDSIESDQQIPSPPKRPQTPPSPTTCMNKEPSLAFDLAPFELDLISPSEFSEPRTTIFLADTSRVSTSIHAAKWENIVVDITSSVPKHMNIRKTYLGLYDLKHDPGYVGNVHCFLKFTKG